MCTIVLCNRA
uniref:Uncharacterized protein n=1 Tax=Arundo donax TaxID=35708 RepID=A0A0A9GUY7_ARUDO